MTIASLARQSASLIRLGSGATAFADQEDLTSGWGDVGVGEEEEATREPSRPKFSTANTLEYYLVRDAIIANIWGGEVRGQTSVINDFINSWVEDRMDNGQYQTFPSADELLTDPAFQNGAWATRFRAAGAPAAFVYTDDTGNQFWVTTVGKQPGIFPLYTTREQIEGAARPGATGVDPTRFNAPNVSDVELTGEPYRQAGDTVPKVASSEVSTSRATEAGLASRTGGGVLESSVLSGDVPPQAAVQGITMNDVDADRRMANRALSQASQGAPTFDSSQLSQLLSRGGGGGGGGGGGRQALAFDDEAMREAARERWRHWFRADPDPDELNNLVRKYQTEAQAFWASKGGRLDFDVYVRERLRERPEYSTMFRFRPPDMGEDQFIAQYEQIEGLGLRSDVSQRYIKSAIQSGGSAADQLIRASRSREASNLAGAGRRFANTVQSLGRLG